MSPIARRILLLLLWSNTAARSQTFEGNQVTVAHTVSSWSRFAVLISSKQMPFSLMMDTQLRIGQSQVLQGRVHLNYYFSPHTSFSIGGIVFTRQESTTTTIALVQILHTFAYQGLEPAVRLRFDYRWLTHHDILELSEQTWRLRLQPAVSIPIVPNLKFALNTEVFLEHATPLLIDENRLQVGVQWQAFDTATLLTAYQNRAFFGRTMKFEHSLFIVLLVRLQV
jgi:hypothetical protein